VGILNDFLCKDIGVGQSKRLPVGHRKSGVTMGTILSPTKLTTRLGSITENQSNCQSNKDLPVFFFSVRNRYRVPEFLHRIVADKNQGQSILSFRLS